VGGLIWRLRSAGNSPRLTPARGDLAFTLVAGGAAAIVVAGALMVSVQAATALRSSP
jgi:hypothetical protein